MSTQSQRKGKYMTDLEQLIETANRFCDNLEKAAQNELKFCYDVCLELERYSWEMHRMANDIKNMKEYYGG